MRNAELKLVLVKMTEEGVEEIDEREMEKMDSTVRAALVLGAPVRLEIDHEGVAMVRVFPNFPKEDPDE